MIIRGVGPVERSLQEFLIEEMANMDALLDFHILFELNVNLDSLVSGLILFSFL